MRWAENWLNGSARGAVTSGTGSRWRPVASSVPRGQCWAQPCSTPSPVTWVEGQSAPSAPFLVTPNGEERLPPQRLHCPSARPGWAGELAERDTGKCHQGQCRVLPRDGQPHAAAQAGAALLGGSSAGKGLGCWGTAGCPRASSVPRWPRGQRCPGVHEEERGRQVGGGDPPLCSALVRPQLEPCPVLGSPVPDKELWERVQ